MSLGVSARLVVVAWLADPCGRWRGRPLRQRRLPWSAYWRAQRTATPPSTLYARLRRGSDGGSQLAWLASDVRPAREYLSANERTTVCLAPGRSASGHTSENSTQCQHACARLSPRPISSTLHPAHCAAISGTLPLQAPAAPISLRMRGPRRPSDERGKRVRRLWFGRTRP
jgi:hypothetical protein